MIRWGSKALRMHSGSRSPLAFISFPNRQLLTANRRHPRSSQIQLPTYTEARMAEALGDRHEHAVMRLLLEPKRTSGVEIGVMREFL